MLRIIGKNQGFVDQIIGEGKNKSPQVHLHYRTLILYSLFVINIMNPVMDCVALYDGQLWPGFSSLFLASQGTAFVRKRLNHWLSAIVQNPYSSYNEKALMHGDPHECLQNITKACRNIHFFINTDIFIVIVLYSLALLSHTQCFVTLAGSIVREKQLQANINSLENTIGQNEK